MTKVGGGPLAGVTVLDKETGASDITDENGFYSLVTGGDGAELLLEIQFLTADGELLGDTVTVTGILATAQPIRVDLRVDQQDGSARIVDVDGSDETVPPPAKELAAADPPPRRRDRKAPPRVDAVEMAGTRFEQVLNARQIGLVGDTGYLRATDIASGRELWVVRVYNQSLDPTKERDVQLRYFSGMAPSDDGRWLIITNEAGERFQVDPSTGDAQRID